MPVRYLVKQIRRFFIYRVLHVDDTPHRIALGVAIGIFVTWTPTVGFQMLLTILLAMLLRANKFVGVPFVWISNPFTIPIIHGPNCMVGNWILGGNLSFKQIWDALVNASNFNGNLVEKIQAFWEATWLVFPPLWLGSLIVAVVLGVATYFFIRRAVIAYRVHRLRRHPAIESAE